MSLVITWPRYLTLATSPMAISLTANEGLGMCNVARFLHIKTLLFLELYIIACSLLYFSQASTNSSIVLYRIASYRYCIVFYFIILYCISDINECMLFPNLCVNGRCRNTIGSFLCTCIVLYHITPYHIVLYCISDINECMLFPNLCVNGRCRNTIGSFLCTCIVSYHITPYHIVLYCISDINECMLFPNLCVNGRCRNTIGSFLCTCNKGFALSNDGMNCTGKHTTV